MNYKAFLFDLNGTMIDDMPYHIKAWHRILTNLGKTISYEATKEQCYGKNHELLERVFPGRFSLEEKDQMSIEKEKQYQQEYKPHLQLIPGLENVLQKANAEGIKIAIGSAALLFNINFVLDGLAIRSYFDAIVSADDVTHSKPDPETFLKCAEKLNLDPKDCLVFEDAPKGVEAAQRAGMDTVVLTTMHTAEEFAYPNIISFMQDFTQFRF